jgi:hypothetical protein
VVSVLAYYSKSSGLDRDCCYEQYAKEKSVTVMTTNYLQKGTKPTPETLYINCTSGSNVHCSFSMINNYQLLKKDYAIDVVYFSSCSHIVIKFAIVFVI